MENKTLAPKQILAVGLMLFALFFGAGNMIFPPFLGQSAGTNVWTAIIGFLITGVGLPLLGIIAIAKNGDLQTIASRVHPLYGIIFTIIMYLAIGPFFGIPRTGTVAFEIGITPFLSETASNSTYTLLAYTIVFFCITAWLSLNPSKLVDRIGSIFTPALLIILAVLVIKSFITPMGELKAPMGAYEEGPFFKGFIEGYLTMDTIAALVFGIIVIGSIQGMGVTNKHSLMKICITAGLIAAAGLAAVYLSLAFIGASSMEAIGQLDNGGAILSAASQYLFGPAGALILGLAITVACLTTSVGLVSACAQYFHKLLPKVPYKIIVIILSLFSMVVANIGLTQLIQLSLPILIIIYPLAIVLILLSFMHNAFNGYSSVYIGALIPTGLISFVDGLKTAGMDVSVITDSLQFLPFFAEGIGWIVPAIAGAVIGYFLAMAFGESKKPIAVND
ncbi:LIVCS family branched-chain amino acid:cation transporter [Cytobacillus firmus]|uniref:Branched-chain amino acid transport system carrier protein n=2 Tax=Cytobacillus TaxID=2675230 RepID=A0A366JY87_CYTFI|nr:MULTISPECIES: branched-chain amino acid transport system II carrier protein [Cytobacillus]RBP93843.1 LIVCS family branched-chain amino acid:cation transporter [Cytobacillus firmus]TDX47743.1 LIVCS family branched-chain amino acid:cation transporter [Cytobacillus oceanisediminis]